MREAYREISKDGQVCVRRSFLFGRCEITGEVVQRFDGTRVVCHVMALSAKPAGMHAA